MILPARPAKRRQPDLRYLGLAHEIGYATLVLLVSSERARDDGPWYLLRDGKRMVRPHWHQNDTADPGRGTASASSIGATINATR